MSGAEPIIATESEVVKALNDVNLESNILDRLAFRSVRVNRLIALHPQASAELLAKLAKSPDRVTRRNVALNPQTSKEVLLELAPSFAGEFFQNPSFELLLIEDPNLLFALPVSVLKNILKRDDCPDSFVNWAARFGNKSHQLAVVGRFDLTKENLQMIADGPNVQAAEIASGRLMCGDFRT